jgi:hypothetical protein
MTDELDVAVIGAGPFGLSVAACLPRLRVKVFGQPMKTWATTMPPDMLLRSAWDETSFASPDGRGSIVDWADRQGISREGPIPLQTFLRYADWFKDEYVADLDPADVVTLAGAGEWFELETTEGRRTRARNIVLAVGVTPFPFAPPALASLDDERVQFAIEIDGFEQFRGRRVVVVGGGQAGLETAGLAARAGAEVELVSRSPIRWFADREPDRPRGRLRQRLYRLAYPAVGYGPPPINRLVLHPDFYAALPEALKRRLTARLLRPGGSPWLRTLIDGHVTVTESTTIRVVHADADALRLELDDGSARIADDLLVATGYRFALERLSFVDERVAAAIRTANGWPVLDREFRSTVPGLFFVGYPAEGRFGPISRFVLGTLFTAGRVASALGAA